MANGLEDLREKNRGREKPGFDSRYRRWSEHLGREDSEMLMEKASPERRSGKKKGWYEY